MATVVERAHWGSRVGFILAAAGSAVGLGNIWGFPYMAGQNGGGLFILVYLLAVALIGLPIMMAEILIGRTAQLSPVGAYRALSAPRSPWLGLGWLSVVAAFIILSFYSVVAGWSMHFLWLSVTDGFAGRETAEVAGLFGQLAGNAEVSTIWHIIFMFIVTGIVAAGIKGGIELCTKILMPALFGLLVILVLWAMTTDGFAPGVKFILGIHDAELLELLDERPGFGPGSALAAVGQAFFSLSLGMGALIAYGSYLRRNDDIVGASIVVSVLDVTVALLAAFIVFPIVFLAGLQPAEGPGLVFSTLPVAFSQMPGGLVLAPIFFFLLAVAAITSAISLLEVATSYFIDERGWPRAKAALLTGGLILLLGIPSALSASSALFGTGVSEFLGATFGEAAEMNWFDALYYLTFNLMLPLGGLGIALFVAWRVGDAAREQAFKTGTRLGKLYWGWVQLLRYIVPLAVLVVFLNAIGVLGLFVGNDVQPEPVEILQVEPAPDE
jgi:neurotransmitter:Na+ symporter, NSS family